MEKVVVKVSPNVYMGIVDAFDHRKHNKGKNNCAMGTLMGRYEQNGVRVTNCFVVPADLTVPQLDHRVNSGLVDTHMKCYNSEFVVGWFMIKPGKISTSDETIGTFQEYYRAFADQIKHFRNQPPIVFLGFDIGFEDKKEPEMLIKAYTDIPRPPPNDEASSDSDEDVEMEFQELAIHLETTDAEAAALTVVMKGLDSKQREVHLEEQTEEVAKKDFLAQLDQMHEWMTTLKQFVDKEMQKPETERDEELGRRCAKILRTATTELSANKRAYLVKTSLRDLMVAGYLSDVTHKYVEMMDGLMDTMPLDEEEE
ncbi:hypothetical protein L596_017472 [Steinernema carpocapsae]|uniref:JAB1/MPN/MOV34 metalloenzyme domain-containing protein n=1 Tax=Steinernema carpocapsae TaxID=34508 RepID=A0A4U5N1S2_STECR|nr:hypothetical protein L596_017472 [Steinernema carpocapsae]